MLYNFSRSYLIRVHWPNYAGLQRFKWKKLIWLSAINYLRSAPMYIQSDVYGFTVDLADRLMII